MKILNRIYLFYSAILRFIIGWILWLVLFIISVIFSILVWNWSEAYTIDMEVIITELLGTKTWNIMIFKNI